MSRNSENPVPSFLGALPESIRRGAALDELYQDLLILDANPMWPVDRCRLRH